MKSWQRVLQARCRLSTPDDDSNGKGKGNQGVLAPDELVQNWSKTQIEAVIKELAELNQNLALKARHPYLCAFFIIDDASYR